MRSRIFWGVALIALALAALIAAPLPAVRTGTKSAGWAPQVMAEEADEHITRMGDVTAYRLDDLEWKPGPVPGTKTALLAGDPKTGMHHAYLKLADGTRIAPHWHTADEYVTVVQGTMMFGRGEKVNPQAARLFGPGAFIHIPARSPHYAWAKGVVVLSQTRSDALDFNWVNPADDPANAKKEAAAPAATK
jgi:quercetin dioxygenase-like cupin family protein